MFSTSPSAEEDVIMEKLANGAARITLNRPKALNALNMSMVKKIYPNLKVKKNSCKCTFSGDCILHSNGTQIQLFE